MAAIRTIDYSAFTPPLRVPCPFSNTGLSSCAPRIRPLHIHPTHPSTSFCRRQTTRILPIARTSDGLPAYRAALLTRRDSPPMASKRSSTIPIPTSPKPDTKRIKHEQEKEARYRVRMAEENELYTVADIRCEAFYGYPKDPYYYPVRRREIYMAMRDRIDSGNKCLVVVDKQPPSEWASFANNGEFVVGSLDVSLHKAASGRRYRFASARGEENGRIYLSSMAVREEWQGRGLAQSLLVQVDAIAVLYGIKEIFLHVEWENGPAVHVYRKSGFVPVEEESRVPRWLHFLAKREHTLMRKRLD